MDLNQVPLIGVQIGLCKESQNESILSHMPLDNPHLNSSLNKNNSIISNTIEKVVSKVVNELEKNNSKENLATKPPRFASKSPHNPPAEQKNEPIESGVQAKNENNRILKDDTGLNETETVEKMFINNNQSKILLKAASTSHINQNPSLTGVNYITEEMQLKAAYEVQLWKEAREKEFEQEFKKIEAKNFQTLAEAFKKHDIERELLVQKKLKEYNDLENILKNSLSEVEKREKRLALNEAQCARLKVDLKHEYENKLLEMREASKRVQENTDHQVNLQRAKFNSLEEEISKLKRQVKQFFFLASTKFI
jgi:hypothetical protein